MSDGAMRTDVLRVLGQEGVEVSALPDSRYRLVKDEKLLTVRLLEVVSRTTLGAFERHFGITKSKFFPPLKVVKIAGPKAVGQTD